MARYRRIKPDYWADEKLAKIPLGARLLYIGLWNFSDDYAVVKGHPAWLTSQIFPYGDVPICDVNDWLDKLVESSRLLPFEVEGERYFYIPKFKKHQKIDRPSDSRNPEPPDEFGTDSSSPRRALVAEVKLSKAKLNKEKLNTKALDESLTESIPYKEIIDDLNEVLGKAGVRRFRHTTCAYRDKIDARLSEGYDLTDFRHVHRVKAAEWLHTDQEKYLNPDTLYRASKFPKYAAQEESTHSLSDTTAHNLKIAEEVMANE